jgi:hypothetical protein
MDLDKEIYSSECIASLLLVIVLSICVVLTTFFTYQTRRDVLEIKKHIERWANLEITQND